MKFKKGDFVEITGSDCGNPSVVGVRFTLENYIEIFSHTLGKYIHAWETLINFSNGTFYARECYLKKVNPDTDEKSSFTFEELLGKLKTDQLEGVE